MKREVDLRSPSFCFMPWVHLSVWTDGRVVPCCDNQDVVFGNVRTESIESAYNSPVARAFRKSMLEGRLPESCWRCSVPERTLNSDSMRKSENRKNAKHLDLVAATEEDGRLPGFRFVSFDIRISNLCNFSCRTCNSINSSEFARVERKLGRLGPGPAVQRAFENFSDFLMFLDRNLESIEEFDFSGGEPLLLKEHYALLDHLIARGKTGVTLKYRSNLSQLSVGGQSATERWKHFPNLQFGASLDGSGTRGEYIRTGTDWARIIENRKRLIAETPHARFWIAPTVQLMNALHIPEFHLDWIRSGLVEPPMIHFNILSEPFWFSLQNLTPGLKRKFKDLWMDYLGVLSKYPQTERVVSEGMQVVRFAFLQESNAEALRRFKSEIRAFDAVYGESFANVFPELTEWL